MSMPGTTSLPAKYKCTGKQGQSTMLLTGTHRLCPRPKQFLSVPLPSAHLKAVSETFQYPSQWHQKLQECQSILTEGCTMVHDWML